MKIPKIDTLYFLKQQYNSAIYQLVKFVYEFKWYRVRHINLYDDVDLLVADVIQSSVETL